MELLSFSVSGTPLLLSASDTGLFVHHMQNERFGHPVLLCSNYKNGLSGCVYSKTLHYTYISRDNALLVRRLHESGILFRLDSSDTVIYSNPQLIVFDNTLYLFYTEESPESCRLKAWRISTDTEVSLTDSLPVSFPAPPLFSLQTTGHYLYLFLTVGRNTVSYRYSSTASFELLHSREELLSGLRLPWENEKARLEETLLKTIRLSEQQQNLLTEKEQKLQVFETKLSELTIEQEQTKTLLAKKEQAIQISQKQLSECTESRQQTLRELEHTSLLLERAKAQYSELMQVAEQYRQEALKWYGKFTDRH